MPLVQRFWLHMSIGAVLVVGLCAVGAGVGFRLGAGVRVLCFVFFSGARKGLLSDLV